MGRQPEPLFHPIRLCRSSQPLWPWSPVDTQLFRWPLPNAPKSPLPGRLFSRRLSYPSRVSILQFNFARWQPFYTLFHFDGSVKRAWSTGGILGLLGAKAKCMRRATKSFATVITFLGRLLPQLGWHSRHLGVCRGYKKRYDYVIHTSLLPFAKEHLSGLVFTLRTITHAYSWRRVAPIKKRTRKRLGIRSGKVNVWLL